MNRLAAKESPAWNFSYHQERLARADLQSGISLTPQSTLVSGNEILVCSGTGDNCDTYSRFSNFQFQGRELFTFDVDGRPLTENIALFQDEEAKEDCWYQDILDSCGSENSLQIRLRSFFLDANDQLQITFDLKRGANISGVVQWEARLVNGTPTVTSVINIDGRRLAPVDAALSIPFTGDPAVNYIAFPLTEGGRASLELNLLWDERVATFDIDILPLQESMEGHSWVAEDPRKVRYTPTSNYLSIPDEMPPGMCSREALSAEFGTAPLFDPSCLGPWSLTSMQRCPTRLNCAQLDVFRWTKDGWQYRGEVSNVCPNGGDFSGLPLWITDVLFPDRQDCLGPISYRPEPQGAILRLGDQGEMVRRMQLSLIDLGLLNDVPDGRFGRNTLNALLDYQYLSGFAPTGVARIDELVYLGVIVPD